jgi:hypothetical protein
MAEKPLLSLESRHSRQHSVLDVIPSKLLRKSTRHAERSEASAVSSKNRKSRSFAEFTLSQELSSCATLRMTGFVQDDVVFQ